MSKAQPAAGKPAVSTYYVQPGVGFINGKATPADGKVSMTEAEALYDLAQGRLSDKPFGKVVPEAPVKAAGSDQ